MPRQFVFRFPTTSVCWLLVCSLALASADETRPLERFESQQLHMGVVFRVVLYAVDAMAAEEGFAAAFSRIRQLDKTLSDYDPESELSRLSHSSPTVHPVQVSGELWHMLRQAHAFSENSGGAFDVTVGPLTRLWRRARRQAQLPSQQRVDEALAAVGYRNVRLDDAQQTVSLLRPNMRFDLGGIAKGYAADEALVVLRSLGIRRALLDASGDIALGDPPPGQAGWIVAIAPLDPDTPPTQFLMLASRGVATSGDSRQSVQINGRSYSHIVDPRTGWALTDHSSVTVVAPNATMADALASSVSVLGPEAGLELIERMPHAAAYIIQSVDERAMTYQSRRFASLLFSKPGTISSQAK